MLRVSEVAQRLSVSPSTVYALAASGRLRCCRVGMGRGCLRFTEEHVAEFLRQSEPPPPPAAAPPKRLRHIRFR